MSIRDLERETLTEMSMVDIVYHLLKESNKQATPFHQLLDEVMALKGLSEDRKVDIMSRLYTEINIDGRFKALGDNVWGLRSWYPVEQAEEIVITEVKKKPKKKRLDEEDDYLDEDLDGLDDEEIDDLDDLDDLDDIDDVDDDDIDDLDDLDEDDDLDDYDESLADSEDLDSIDEDIDDAYEEEMDDLDDEDADGDVDEDEDNR